METGDTVQVKADALALWADDESMLTPALLVHLGAPNRFTVRDVVQDVSGQYIVLECCRAFKSKGAEVCHAHPVELFEPYVPVAEPVEPTPFDGEPERVEPVQRDRETSITVPVLGRIFKLGQFRDEGGTIRMKIAGLDEFEINGAVAGPVGKFLEGLGIL